MTTYFQEQLLRINREVYPHPELTQQIVRAKRFVDKNYHLTITLTRIAGEGCCSKFHFIRLFRKYYGCTPGQYLTEVRVAQAKKLLESGQPVTGTCFAVGFSSVTSFAGLFRKVTGTSPSAYQRKKMLGYSAVNFSYTG